MGRSVILLNFKEEGKEGRPTVRILNLTQKMDIIDVVSVRNATLHVHKRSKMRQY